MEQTNPQPNPPITQQVPSNPPVTSPSQNKSILMVLLVVLLVVLSFLIAYLFVKSQSPSQTLVVSYVPLFQPTPTPDPTASWKTYTNEQAGYSLKYPDTWSFLARSEGCGPVFSPPDTKQIWLTVCGLYINSTDTPQNLANGTATSAVKISEVPIIIDNHLGIKQELTTNNQQEINTFIGDIYGLITYAGGETKKEKGTLGIYYYIQDLTKIDSAKHDLDQILSTFKFTDFGPTVLGIQTTTCCSCPTKIPESYLGKDGWVAYEKGKDYNSQLPENCQNIQCVPCPPIDF